MSKHQTKWIPTDAGKRCPACGVQKPWADFASNRARRDGRSTYCRACTSLMSKNYAKTGSWTLPAGSNGRTPPDVEAADTMADALEMAATEQIITTLAPDVAQAIGERIASDELARVAAAQGSAALSSLELGGATPSATPPGAYVAHASVRAPEAREWPEPLNPDTDGVMEAADTLADFLTLQEAPSAFVHPKFCVVSVALGDITAHYILTPDSGGPRAMVPAALVGYISGLLAGERPECIYGRLYY